MSGDLKERIEVMLAGLGDTADAVADSLRAKGITGLRDNGCNCPIARLIQDEVPEAARPAAEWDDQTGMWFVGLAHIRTPAGDIDVSPPIAEFIEVFDNGRGGTAFEPGEYPYADLDEDAEDEDEPGVAARAEQ